MVAAAMRPTQTRLHELTQAEQELVFGRLDSRDGDVLRVGRVGVPSVDDDADPLVVDPDGIVAEPRGWNGLYVALTRCTQELGRVEIA